MNSATNPRFEVEVAANGFILKVFTPDNKKTPGSTATFVFPSKSSLFNQMSVYLTFWGQEEDEEREKILDTV